MSRLTRRAALRLAGGVGAAGLLAACTDDHGTTAQPATSLGTVTGSPSPSSTSAATSGPAGPDWSRLDAAVDGRVVRPTTSGYTTAVRLYNPRFDASSRPAAIAYCTSPADVQAAVRFAADGTVPFVMRCGGHSYPGWSTSSGLVIDVSSMSAVSVDTSAGTARIQAGAHLDEVYAALAAHGVGIAAGSCATVGVSGLTMGGGIGVLTRAWGLTCDQVVGMEIVTADGNLRTVDANHDPDLFWALRGGGGGSFGAVTAFTMKVRPAPTVITYYLDWPAARATDVVAAWQPWVSAADSRLASSCKLLADAPGTFTPMIAGTWVGPASALDAQLAPLIAAIGTPTSNIVHSHTYAAAMLSEAGCSGKDAAACTVSALTPAKRQAFAATSSIADVHLAAAGISAAVTSVQTALSIPGIIEGGVSFDALGGAVGDLAADATSFGHRDAFATVQYTATYSSGGPARFDTFVRGLRATMKPWLGDGAYVNYADETITDYPGAYWGANYPRLQQVKRAIDPDNLFTFPQAVRG